MGSLDDKNALVDEQAAAGRAARAIHAGSPARDAIAANGRRGRRR